MSSARYYRAAAEPLVPILMPRGGMELGQPRQDQAWRQQCRHCPVRGRAALLLRRSAWGAAGSAHTCRLRVLRSESLRGKGRRSPAARLQTWDFFGALGGRPSPRSKRTMNSFLARQAQKYECVDVGVNTDELALTFGVP